MLAIQEYISLFPDIEKANEHLTEDLHIRIKKQGLLLPDSVVTVGVLEDVYLYNYHPVKSPRGNSIVEECNGLILNDRAEIVSMSFPRLYNMGEQGAPEMEWDHHARAELQADGVLVVVFNYKGKWHLQTKIDVHAVGNMSEHRISIRVGAMTVLNTMFEDERGPFYPFEKCDEENLCYVFEFVSPYNRFITPYHDANLILLAVFDKKKLVEKSEKWLNYFQRNYCDGWMFPRPRAYGVEEAKYIGELTQYMDIKQKGFIVVDLMGNRIKVKNPIYHALEKVLNSKGEVSPEAYARIALSGYAINMQSAYPEYTHMLSMFTSSIISITESATHAWEEYYGKYAHRDDYYWKEFACRISHLPKMFRTILFRMRQEKIDTISQGVREMRPKTLVMATKKGYGNLFNDEVRRLKRVMQAEVELED